MNRPSPLFLRRLGIRMGIVAALGCAIAPLVSAADTHSIPRVRDNGDVTLAAPHRLLRIVVDLRRARDQVMAAIGHELRHALEVLLCPSIRDSAAMYFFYDLGNPTKNESFETRAAVEAGLDIAAELKHAA